MTEIFKMPDIGEGMAEGEISSWLVKVGDTVKEEDAVAEVQNDKLLQELLSPYAGKVTKLFVDAGTTVSVGDPIIEFDGDGTGTAENDTQSKAPAKTVETESNTVDNQQPTDSNTSNSADSQTGAPIVNGRVQAMPSVRQYARQHNIDLTQVPATGRHGHITFADVQSFTGQTSEQPSEQPTPDTQRASASDQRTPQAEPIVQSESVKPPKVGRVPMTPIRRAIAKNMVAQKQNLPHVTVFDEVEVTKLVEHRRAFKATAAQQDVKLTYMAYFTKALAAVGKKFPELNAYIDDDKQEIVYGQEYNVGIAVDTPQGLFVPVIKGADHKSIMAIAKEIEALAQKARDNQLSPEDMSNGTVTISNIGSAGGQWFTPVINVNEAAILGVGKINKEAIVAEDGQLAVGQMLKLSLSFDHRLIDGVLAQQAVNYLKLLLADPAYMLMEV